MIGRCANEAILGKIAGEGLRPVPLQRNVLFESLDTQQQQLSQRARDAVSTGGVPCVGA